MIKLSSGRSIKDRSPNLAYIKANLIMNLYLLANIFSTLKAVASCLQKFKKLKLVSLLACIQITIY